jgi:hypothetical protein
LLGVRDGAFGAAVVLDGAGQRWVHPPRIGE